MREREAYNNKLNVFVQAPHLCWSMSVKSSIARCLSNAVVKVNRNCWERSLNIAVIKYFRNDTFEKITITATEAFLFQLFYYTVVSKQKTKIKGRNTIAPSYQSKATSTQNKGVPFFCCLAHGVLYYKLGIRVFPIILACQF